MIYGLGIYNMKGALVCYTQAVKALKRAGVKLEGDVTIAAVVGEIEKTQWATNSSVKNIAATAVGTHHLVNHGVLPDMCILGEPTDMQLVLGHLRIAVGAHFYARPLTFTRHSAQGNEDRIYLPHEGYSGPHL